MMKGRIWVESALGKGSNFHVTAWFGLHTSPTEGHAPATPVDLQGVRVLVLDANPINRRVLSETLAAWRMTPTAVGGGPAALEAMERARAAEEPYPLALVSSRLSQADLRAVAGDIDRITQDHRPSVVVLTYQDGPGDDGWPGSIGPAAFVPEPFRQSDVLGAITRALGARGVPQERSPHIAVHRTLRILVAEDNSVNQLLARRLLEKRGHEVVLAENGREALEVLEREPMDLVLMDVHMPHMDGFEATEAIREKEKSTGDHLPIVAMTASAMKGDRERCLEAGMDSYVSKPLRAKVLLEVVEDQVRAMGDRPMRHVS